MLKILRNKYGDEYWRILQETTTTTKKRDEEEEEEKNVTNIQNVLCLGRYFPNRRIRCQPKISLAMTDENTSDEESGGVKAILIKHLENHSILFPENYLLIH